MVHNPNLLSNHRGRVVLTSADACQYFNGPVKVYKAVINPKTQKVVRGKLLRVE